MIVMFPGPSLLVGLNSVPRNPIPEMERSIATPLGSCRGAAGERAGERRIWKGTPRFGEPSVLTSWRGGPQRSSDPLSMTAC